MKVLVVTQAVDTHDPVLGFFVGWLQELSARVERIEVICLKEGKHSLPANVSVHSLGKERGSAHRAAYAWRFLSLIRRLRADYDTVFVHMNPEYVILGGLLWRLWGKHIAFWYNHPKKDIRLFVAAVLAHKIFCTSAYAATARMKKAKRMSAGIDTNLFRPYKVVRNRTSLYMQGRITPSKRVEIACDSVRIVRHRIPQATLTLVGPEDAAYGARVRDKYSDLISTGALVFSGPRMNAETPELFAAAGASVNLAASGHFDKSVLESMACGTPVVISSNAFSGLVPEEWVVPEEDAQALAEAFTRLINLPDDAYAALAARERDAVVQTQSLSVLMGALTRELEESMAS
jgi:glycosyltransferase involved in cell wall biosynthesis